MKHRVIGIDIYQEKQKIRQHADHKATYQTNRA